MALIPIAQRRPNVIQTKAAKSGGGQLGQILGLAGGALIGGLAAAAGGPAGAAAAAPTAAAIAGGALGGASTGSMLGGLIGGTLSPGQAPEFKQVDPARMSNVQLSNMGAQLLSSINTLENYPDLTAQYGKPLVQAYMNTQIALKNRDRGGIA